MIADWPEGGDAHPQIVIHGELERGIQRANPVPKLGPEERRLLRNMDIASAESPVIGLSSRELANSQPSFVDVVSIAVDHSDIGVVGQELDGFANGSRAVEVIGV
jgi:hypothetical protein